MMHKELINQFLFIQMEQSALILYGCKKQQQLKSMLQQEQRSYYFGEMNYEVNKDQSITLTDLSKLINKCHTSIIQKIDQRVGKVQKTLTNLFMQRFDELSHTIQQIKSKVGLQKAVTTAAKNEMDQNPFAFIRAHSQQLQDEQINQVSQMVNIYQFYDEEQKNKYNKSYVSQEDVNLFDPSQLLQHLRRTFDEMDLKFTTSEALYDFPYMKFTDFHTKIDNKDNIFFLALLQNNQIIGAFSHLCFDSKPIYIPKQNPKSFICNLTQNIYAYAYRTNKTHTHDPNYLIFGNWQIKVKNGEDILQTDWATNGDCFSLKKYGKKQTHKMKVNEFFGQGAQARKLKIKRYSFYVFS